MEMSITWVARVPEFRWWKRPPSKPSKTHPSQCKVITNPSRNQMVSTIVMLPFAQKYSILRTKEEKWQLIWRNESYRQTGHHWSNFPKPAVYALIFALRNKSDNTEDRCFLFSLEKFYVGNWHLIHTKKRFQSWPVSLKLRERVLRSLLFLTQITQ